MKKKMFIVSVFVLFCSSPAFATPIKVEIGDGLGFLKYNKNHVMITTFGDGWEEQYGFGDINWGSFEKMGNNYSITGLVGLDFNPLSVNPIPMEITLNGSFGTIEAEDYTYSLNVCGDLKYGFSYASIFAIDEHTAAPVPEPATVMLFGIGSLGLAFMRKNKKDPTDI